MQEMKAAVVPEVDAPWELRDVPMPAAGPHQVLVRIHACGLCYTDALIARGVLSFRPFPMVLGHEGVGEVVAVGEGVTARRVGDRVGLPITQKACGRCAFCRERHPYSFVTANHCAAPVLTGVNVDGGQAEYIAADEEGTILLPDDIPYEYAAPTVCAGYTVWAALRRADPKPDARVAVLGIGGVGHLGIQFAKAAGYHVTALTHSPAKHDLARELGADEVVSDGAALEAAGGADVLLHTSPRHEVAVDALAGLRPWGKLVLMGISADDAFPLPALAVTSHSFQVIGSAHNSPEYLAEALEIVARGDVTPMVDVFPKEKVDEAYQRLLAGQLRFRGVVTY
ncbi:alcohol dehydrogenase catalytic domain-containing protein [Asanoa sp. WMMD1127]|uniref:alcohol dehydrogenase catalytic domain-containing protein n=1 Tax=Asanoa sp. WMMD1127 TaxID=3016107 RepID=UPI002417E3DA|nr:alcohol dehydrogenase catalytic domain-containing protein [Asanoa sp. WMMD1127]MDG4824339.1 alcohol dehydrogenase catalytic domain-containing protein [Asanoa sp. WMMD1127]